MVTVLAPCIPTAGRTKEERAKLNETVVPSSVTAEELQVRVFLCCVLYALQHAAPRFLVPWQASNKRAKVTQVKDHGLIIVRYADGQKKQKQVSSRLPLLRW